jgi:hypothetical protein
MNKIKIFKTSSKDLEKIQEAINAWIEEKNVNVVQVETISGETYSTFGSRVDEKEIFLIILYKNKNNNIKKKT